MTAIVPSELNKLRCITFFPVEKIYTDNEKSNRRYIGVCNECAIKLLKSTIKILAIIFASLSIYSIFPLVATIRTDEVQLIMPFLFPATNLDTQTGIVINMLNQIILGLMAMSSNLGIEILNCILSNTVWSSSIVICYSIDEYSHILKRSNKNSNGIDNHRFRNIIIQLHDVHR